MSPRWQSAFIGFAIAVAGCTDPSVEVHFDVPPVIENDVQNLRLRVLAPANEGFDCDQLAFGEVPKDAVDGATVADLRTAVGNRVTLPQIPRKGQKLFWVEAADDTGLAVAAGCTEHGDIDNENEVIEVLAEPTKTGVMFSARDAGTLVTVLVFDSFEAADRVESVVKWELVGANDFVESEEVTTIDQLAQLQLPRPTHYGPVTINARLRWARTPIDPLLGFCDPPVSNVLPMPGTADLFDTLRQSDLFTAGRFGPGGVVAVAATAYDPDGNGGAGTSDTIAFWLEGSTLVSATLNLMSDPLVSLTTVQTGSGDKLVGITPTALHDLTVTPTTIVVDPAPRAHALGVRIRKFESLHDCEQPTGAPRFVVELGTPAQPTVAVITNNGQELGNYFPPGFTASAPRSLLATGCVGMTDGTVARTLLLELEDKAGVHALTDGPERLFTLFGLTISAAGFSPAVGTTPPELLVTEFSFDGFSLTAMQLETVSIGSASRLSFAPRQSTPLVAAAVSVDGGDVDGNGEPDSVSIVAFGSGTTTARLSVEAILGRAQTEDVVLGITGSILGEAVIVTDFNADGIDDVFIGSSR